MKGKGKRSSLFSFRRVFSFVGFSFHSSFYSRCVFLPIVCLVMFYHSSLSFLCFSRLPLVFLFSLIFPSNVLLVLSLFALLSLSLFALLSLFLSFLCFLSHDLYHPPLSHTLSHNPSSNRSVRFSDFQPLAFATLSSFAPLSIPSKRRERLDRDGKTHYNLSKQNLRKRV